MKWPFRREKKQDSRRKSARDQLERAMIMSKTEAAFFACKRTMRWEGERIEEHQVIKVEDPEMLKDCRKSGYFTELTDKEAKQKMKEFQQKQAQTEE